jgi:hypothetical protein
MLNRTIKDLSSLIDELYKWQSEKRVVSAAFLIAGTGGSTNIFVKGEIVDTSGLRLRIVGWGVAAFLLVGAGFTPKLSEEVKGGIEAMQGGAPVNWGKAISLEFSNGSLLVLWSEAQTE